MILESALATAITSVVIGHAVSGNSIFRMEAARSNNVRQVNLHSKQSWQCASLIEQINQLEALPEGWDGDDAERISTDAARVARTFIAAFRGMSAPSIFPNSSGTLSMEWDSPQGEAVLEIGESRYSFYLSPKMGEASYRKGTTDELVDEAALLSKLIDTRLSPAEKTNNPTLVEIRMGTTIDDRLAA